MGNSFQTAFAFRYYCFLQLVFLCQNPSATVDVCRRENTGIFKRIYQIGGTVVADAQLALQGRNGSLAALQYEGNGLIE